jgi:hypothetical protein
MAFTPTTNLSLPLIDTGTESGTWGELVDNGLTSYLDIAIAGGLAITITTADVTLTKTAGTSSVTNIASTTAQYAILNISGTKTAARNLNLPITSKWYIINNAGNGGFLLTVRGVTPTTGVTLVDGEEAIVAWTGSDYIKVASSVVSALSGTLSAANGGTGAATLAANNVLLGNGTSALQVVAPSTNGNVLTSNGTTWTSTAPTVAVSSVNSQTGAVVTTTLGNIGSVLIAANTTTGTYYLPGSTATGSSLVYTSTFVSASGIAGVVSNGTVGGSDYTYNTSNGATIRVTTSNVGYQSPLGMTALSGTWRALAFIAAASVTWDGTNNNSYSPMGLWVRVS